MTLLIVLVVVGVSKLSALEKDVRNLKTQLLPAGQAEAEALYRLVDAAYERRSLAVTSNIHPSAFDTMMPKALAIPTVDRLLHHDHVIITEGESQRLAQAMAGKGVVPIG